MARRREYPDYKTVRRLFAYNRKTGLLKWKSCTRKHLNANSVGCITPQGYLVSGMNFKGKNRIFFVHRLIWIGLYGYNPENQIDHIDRDKLNNRSSNLREVTSQCNLRNSKLPRDNKSGVKGVSWEKQFKKWRASIRVNCIATNLGSFEDFDEAVCLRLAAEQCLDWSGCDSASPAFLYVKNNIQKTLKLNRRK